MLDGVAVPEDIGRLKTTGPWLAKYGESVFGTKGGPFPPCDWGGTVYRGDVSYVHVLKWPKGPVSLPAGGRKVLSASCLTGGRVKAVQSGDGIVLTVPKRQRNPIDTVVKLVFDASLEPVARSAPYRGSLTVGRAASASSFTPGHGPDEAVDADAATAWRPEGAGEQWLCVDLGKPTTFQRIALHVENPAHVRGRATPFSVEVQREDGSWRQVCAASIYGDIFEKRIESATGRYVRLRVAADGVRQFDLY